MPVRPDPDQRDSGAEIWAVSLETGQVTSKTTARKREHELDPNKFGSGDPALLGSGNLVFHEGLVFAQSPWAVTAFPDLEVKKAEMDRRLAANPNDPAGLTDRGELLLDEGKLKDAIADFKAAQAARPAADVERTLQQRLYQAYTELLRIDFPAAEPALAEYQALCDVSVRASRTRPSGPARPTRTCAARGCTCACWPRAARSRAGWSRRSTTTSPSPTSATTRCWCPSSTSRTCSCGRTCGPAAASRR